MRWILSLIFILFSFSALANGDLGYDPGPNPETPEGQGYIDLVNSSPDAPYMGKKFYGRDKFRYPFGLMPWRGPTEKNSVKVLVIGQDGTHIAEAAGRPFTGGTGGRLQGALKFLGIRDSAMFINTFSYTIYGQYADYAPVLRKRGDGSYRVERKQILTPEAYLLAQDPRSPYVQWRNKFIDHIIRSNPDSLKLIIVVGGAAADTMGTYINARGGEAKTNVSAQQLRDKKYQAVLYKSARAGGNRSFFYPIDSDGKNVLLNPGESMPRTYEDELQYEHMRRANDRINQMVFMKSGEFGNGFLTPAQFGYNIYKFKGEAPGTLKGLKLADGTVVSSDIRIIKVKHPGSLSPSLSRNFKQNFEKLLAYERKGWDFYQSDRGETNRLKTDGNAEAFNFNAKPPIPLKDFPLGKTRAVIVNSSLAGRNGKQIIFFGGRTRPTLDRDMERKAKTGLPAEGTEFYENKQPWNPAFAVDQMDRGPGKDWAELFLSIDEDKVFKTKPGKTFSRDGIDAYYVKNTPKHGAFGFFRGDVVEPKVIIFADPSSLDLDDLYTARALTGENGQYLQGLMNQLEVNDNYLVIKTLPFDMTGADREEWHEALSRTQKWRDQIYAKAITLNPKLVITLGSYAQQSFEDYKERNHLMEPDYIPLTYAPGSFADNFDNLKRALTINDSRPYQRKMASIPRKHLPYPMQAWIGTSGMRGVRGKTGTKFEGDYYAIVAPGWVISEANRVARASRNGLVEDPEGEFVELAKEEVKNSSFAELGRTTSKKGPLD